MDFISTMGRCEDLREARIAALAAIIENELTLAQQIAVTEHLLNGRTFCAIAKDYGVGPSTIYKNYKRGIAKLKRFTKYVP